MRLSIVGDISLSSLDIEQINIDSRIIDKFEKSDFVLGNLENPITESSDKNSKLVVNLKSGCDSIKILKYFDCLHLGNNHIFDYGVRGMQETKEFCIMENIGFFGVGDSISKAETPFIDDEKKLMIVTATRWFNAGKNKAGTNRFKNVERTIKQYSKLNYFIIYYPHWGYEYITTPPPDVRKHAKKMIDYGVDLIVGTHPHILQGFEIYKGKHIFYSLGNFIFHKKHMNPKININLIDKSIILIVDIDKGKKYNVNIIYIKYSNEQIEYDIKLNEDGKLLEELSKPLTMNYSNYKQNYYQNTIIMAKESSRIRSRLKSEKKGKYRYLSLLQNYKQVTFQDLLNRLYAVLYSLKMVK